MQAMDLMDNSLQWETERQNRIHQAALDQKKKQMRVDGARSESEYAGVLQADVSVASEAWIDKIHRIPDMRSALVPLDEKTTEEEWSKPFSLAKADMEPWLSFYKGYKQSRLFLETAAPQATLSGDQHWPSADYGVRAILELKQASIKLMAEPPVQINRQVEYFDLEGELQVNKDPMRVKALLKSAASIHDAELRRAVEKGREMGNLLYDALMGEGHGNLIKAWVKIFNRKPTVEELHLMLTTGRVKAATERKPHPAELRPSNIERQREAAVEPATPVKRREPPVAKEPLRIEPASIAKLVADTEPDDDVPQAAQDDRSNRRKIVLHLVQAAACCAALVAIVFVS